jgi:hypothetical protein
MIVPAHAPYLGLDITGIMMGQATDRLPPGTSGRPFETGTTANPAPSVDGFFRHLFGYLGH